jgi:hypothetical protein
MRRQPRPRASGFSLTAGKKRISAPEKSRSGVQKSLNINALMQFCRGRRQRNFRAQNRVGSGTAAEFTGSISGLLNTH